MIKVNEEFIHNETRLITITLREYNRIKDDSMQLTHLECLGVDNWEGYSYYKDEEGYND